MQAKLGSVYIFLCPTSNVAIATANSIIPLPYHLLVVQEVVTGLRIPLQFEGYLPLPGNPKGQAVLDTPKTFSCLVLTVPWTTTEELQQVLLFSTHCK